MHETNVLLIEHNDATIELIGQCLSNLSYLPEQVTVCHSVNEATHHPAAAYTVLIIALSIYDLAEHGIKQLRQQFPYQPVIVIAGKDQEENALKAIASGADDYIIRKEINETVLQKAIRCATARNNINFKQLFEESPAPMFIYEKKTFRFLAVNKACCMQYGYKEDEFLQMTAEEIRPSEDIPDFRNVSKIIPEEYHDYGRWRHCKKNGEIFMVNIYAHDAMFGDKDARLLTAVDVSNTVRTEQELNDKNKEVTNILESITDGFFALNRIGEFTYVNKECERIFGIKRRDVIGRNIRDVYDKEEYATLYNQYRQAENKRTNMRFENYISSIGKWLSVTVYSTKNGMAVYLMDVTERRQIREKLYNDGQQLRAIINNTPDIIWLLNSEGQITVRNDAFRQWMQHLVEDAETHTLPPAIAHNWTEHFDIAFGGRAVTFTAMETKGSELFYREVSLNPQRSAAGEVINISCFARDVTQQQMRIHKIQLQNEYLEKIAWMHSHEARGPVANILGLASLFDVNDPGDPDNKMMMELIIESAHLLDKVIRRIVADIDNYQLNYGDEE